jgi:hypothetical protein
LRERDQREAKVVPQTQGHPDNQPVHPPGASDGCL